MAVGKNLDAGTLITSVVYKTRQVVGGSAAWPPYCHVTVAFQACCPLEVAFQQQLYYS